MEKKLEIKLNENRDISWDIVKAVCIILMVFAHTRIPRVALSFIFMFHMGVFYFVAGYFLKTGASTKQTVRFFVKKKLVALYKPYVIFGLLMVLLNPLMYKYHWEASAYSLQDIAKYSIKTILFAGPLGYGVALWFLKSLFFSLGILLIILQLVKSEKERALLVMLLYSIGWTLARYKIDVPWSLSRDITVVILCYLGYIGRRLPPPYINSWNHQETRRLFRVASYV